MFDAVAQKWQSAQPQTSEPWNDWDPLRRQIQDDRTQAGYRQAPNFNLDPDWLKSLGYDGPSQFTADANSQRGDQSAQTAPEFMKWLQDNGYKLQQAGTGDAGGNKHLGRMVDANGNQVGDTQQWNYSNDDAFGLAALAAGGFAGAAAMGAGAAGAGATSGMDLAADAGYMGANGVGGAGEGLGGLSSASSFEAPSAVGGQSYISGDVAAGSNGSWDVAGGGGLGGDGAFVGESPWTPTPGGGGMPTSGGTNWLDQASSLAKQYPGVTNALGGLATTALGGYFSGRALDKQQGAISAANAEWQPYHDFGVQNLGRSNALLADPSSIAKDPGYQFTTAQGIQALDRSAAAKGGVYSGAQGKAQQRFGQENANTYFDKILGRYTGAAQLGATGTTNISNNLIGGGNAAAGQSLLMGNVANNGFNNALGQWNFQNGGYGQPWNQSQYPTMKPGP